MSVKQPPKYRVVIVPKKALLPDDLTYPTKLDGDLVDKMNECRTQRTIIAVDTRELQLLIEYRDLFDMEILAVIGLNGAIYNTIWNSYVSSMKRVTLDDLIAEAREAANANADAGQRQVTNPVVRRRELNYRTEDTDVRSKGAGETRADRDSADTGEDPELPDID